MEEAQSCTQKLCALVEQILESNRDLAERIRGLEREGSIISNTRSVIIPADDAPATRQSIAARETIIKPGDTLVKRFAFEDDLESSRVYSKAIYRFSQLSMTSTALYTTAFSVFSKLSLSQVSNISFYALPLCAIDLHNSELYIFGEDGAVVLDRRAIPTPVEQPPCSGSQVSEVCATDQPTPKDTSSGTSSSGELQRTGKRTRFPALQAIRKQTGLLGRFATLQERTTTKEILADRKLIRALTERGGPSYSGL